MRQPGKNLAIQVNQPYGNLFNNSISSGQTGACIFLSHIREDKNYVKKIGDYIMQAGFNIYLDIYDSDLQKADEEDNHESITNCL